MTRKLKYIFRQPKYLKFQTVFIFDKNYALLLKEILNNLRLD